MYRRLDKRAPPAVALDDPVDVLYIGEKRHSPTISGGRVRAEHLRLAVSTTRAERRGARADPWRTISGWLWTAYVAGVVALAAWLWI